MENLARDPSNPYLLSSSLFAKNLPGAVKDEDIRRIFKDFEVSRVQITYVQEPSPGGNGTKQSQSRKWKKGTKIVQIEFASIAVAEKALAVLNGRIVPGFGNPILLTLSPSWDHSPMSNFTGNPRIVKFLPSHYTNIELYALIRPFGPLVSARVDHTLGAVVQFWNEDGARAAEVAVHTAFARSSKIILQAYDPCNIYCSNLCPNLEEPSLRALFEPFGVITSARVMRGKKGRSFGYGFVAFKSPNEASGAISALQGTMLGSKSLMLRYHEPKMPLKPIIQPTQSKMEAPNTDDTMSNESRGTGWSDSDKSSEGTAVASSPPCEMVDEDERSKYENGWQYEEELVRLRAEVAESQNLISSERERTEGLHSQIRQLEAQLSDLKATLHETELDRDALRMQSEEWCKRFMITDSRLKIVELEGDRPLWEEARKKREMKEKEEAEKVEKAKRAAELLESERRMRELREQEKQRILEEKARKAREEAQRKAREREIAEERERTRLKEKLRLERWNAATQAERLHCRTRDTNMWAHVAECRWENKHALERVTLVSTEFGQAKFSEELPLTFENIPWPVLGNPLTLDVEDITWDSVEAFFAYTKSVQGACKYKKYVETIHRLFHPDKWRARRALETVMDATLRQSLEKAGNTVSQAITPLWRDTKTDA